MESLTTAQLLEAIRDKESIASGLTRKLLQSVATFARIQSMKPDETMNESRIAATRSSVEQTIAFQRKQIQETEEDIVKLKAELRDRVTKKRSSDIDAIALARRKLIANARDQIPFVPAPRVQPKKTMTGRKWVALPKGGRRRVTRRRRLYRQ